MLLMPNRVSHPLCLAERGTVQGERLQASRVTVSVEKTERNTRNCFACIYIAVPLHIVWGALTDYDKLGTFIPGKSRQLLARCICDLRLGWKHCCHTAKHTPKWGHTMLNLPCQM